MIILSPVLNDPVETESHDSVEKDLSHNDEESKAAACPCRHSVVVMFPLSGRNERRGGFSAGHHDTKNDGILKEVQ